MMLLVDNYDSFTYNLYQDLALKTDNILVKRNDQITLDDIKKLEPSNIVLSPGPGHPEQAGLCIDIIKTFSGQIPILGICLGHQSIGCAFGGKVIKARNVMHGKTSMMTHNNDPIFKGTSNPFSIGRYHSLVIDPETISDELEVLATTDDSTIMAIKHKTHPTYGLQFHPESILTPDGPRLLTNFIEISQKVAL